MEILLDPGRLSAGADAVETGAGDMRARRAEIASAVDAVLATWRGDAASRFTELWEQWSAGADQLISELSSSAAALHHAREQVQAVDTDRRDEHARLKGRLALEAGPAPEGGTA